VTLCRGAFSLPAAALHSKQQRVIWNEECPFHDQQLVKLCRSRRERTGSSSAAVAFSVLLLVISLVCVGCQNALPPLPNPPGPHTAVRLSPGDVIKVAYADESIPDQAQKIRRDGKVSLPLIGEATAAGKRVLAFQNELISRYEGKLDNNEVLVTLENGSATVTVSGFANRPSVFTFDRPTTVYQAVMQAGGVSDYGSPSNIHLTRIVNGAQLSERINLRPTIRGEATRPTYVQDGDVIYIARSLF
jgi:polysaccharide export outer membrane protein